MKKPLLSLIVEKTSEVWLKLVHLLEFHSEEISVILYENSLSDFLIDSHPHTLRQIRKLYLIPKTAKQQQLDIEDYLLAVSRGEDQLATLILQRLLLKSDDTNCLGGNCAHPQDRGVSENLVSSFFANVELTRER